MNLRPASNAWRPDCICDPLDTGSATRQTACSICRGCPLRRARPIMINVIPVRVLGCYHVEAEVRYRKVRALVRYADERLGANQNWQTLSIVRQSEGVV